MALYDIKIDKPFNTEGDFNITESDFQNVEAIILAEKGHFYQFPILGVGITGAFNSPTDVLFLRSIISEELAKDNYILTNYETDLTNGKVIITLNAERFET